MPPFCGENCFALASNLLWARFLTCEWTYELSQAVASGFASAPRSKSAKALDPSKFSPANTIVANGRTRKSMFKKLTAAGVSEFAQICISAKESGVSLMLCELCGG